MGARLRVRERDLGDAFRRRRRVDRAVAGVEDPAMAVRGVLAETNVRRDEQRGEESAQLFYGLDHGAPWVVGGRAARVLFALERHAEEDDAPETLLHQWADEALQSIDAPPALPWQRWNLDAGCGVVGDKYGVHEHGLVKSAARLPLSRERVVVTTLEDRSMREHELVTNIRRITKRKSTCEMSSVMIHKVQYRMLSDADD